MSRVPAEIDAHSTPPPHPPGRVADRGGHSVDRNPAQARCARTGPPAPGSGRFLLHQSELDSRPSTPPANCPRFPAIPNTRSSSRRPDSSSSAIWTKPPSPSTIRRTGETEPPDRLQSRASRRFSSARSTPPACLRTLRSCLLQLRTTAVSTSTTFPSKAAPFALSFFRMTASRFRTIPTPM